jgi:hypothetical protein
VNSNFLVIAAFASAMVVFVFPLFLLGTVTPSLAAFTIGSLEDSGKVVGRLGACNTIGSIIGTFLPTFVTIPSVGTAVTFLIFAGILIVLCIIYFLSGKADVKRVAAGVVLFAVCCVFCRCIFAGRQFKQLWTSIEAMGETEGTIRNMSIRYIREVKKGVIEVKPVNDWHIEGFDRQSASYKKAAELLRAGKIKLHNSAYGKYTNIVSLNERDLK